jgi:hypothetical protein
LRAWRSVAAIGKWTKNLFAQALERTARGGRLAFFSMVSEFWGRLPNPHIPNLEWTIFATCEEIDSWWQASEKEGMRAVRTPTERVDR